MKRIKSIVAVALAATTMLSCGITANAEFVQANDDVLQYIVDGEPVTGWFTHNGERYYAEDDGTLAVSEWKQSANGSNKYYFTSDGSAATGFVKIKGKIYCFTSNGVMRKGWVQTNSGKRYFASTDGTMRTGWLVMKNGNKYYCNKNTGFAVTGWQKIDGYYYYFDKNGVMCVDDMTVNGVTYTFETDGKCLQFTDKANSALVESTESEVNSTNRKQESTVKTTDGVRVFTDLDSFVSNSSTFTFGNTIATDKSYTMKRMKEMLDYDGIVSLCTDGDILTVDLHMNMKTQDVAMYMDTFGVKMYSLTKDGESIAYDIVNKEYQTGSDAVLTNESDTTLDLDAVDVTKGYTVRIAGVEYWFEHNGDNAGYLFDMDTKELLMNVTYESGFTTIMTIDLGKYKTFDAVTAKYIPDTSVYKPKTTTNTKDIADSLDSIFG